MLDSSMISTPSTARTPIATSLPALPTSGKITKNRRILTDEDRMCICQYAAEHPEVRQIDIGFIFEVERSTVSKILRDKGKYFSQDDESSATSRRAKSKPPDVERALSNWARNQHKRGLSVPDSLIKEKLCVFATTIGNTYDLVELTSDSWLDKFKVKNGLPASRCRKKIVTEDIDAVSHPGAPESSEPVKVEHKRSHSLSTELLMSASAGAMTASSPGSMSPQSPVWVLNDASAFVPPDRSRSSSSGRKLRQTSLMLGEEPCLSPSSLVPKYTTATAAASSIQRISVLNPSVPSCATPIQPLRLLPSQNLEVPPPVSPSRTVLQLSSGTITNPTLPGNPECPRAEEALRATEVVTKFFEQHPTQILTPQAYFVMGRLMEIVRVQASQSPPPATLPHIRFEENPGDMRRITEGCSILEEQLRNDW